MKKEYLLPFCLCFLMLFSTTKSNADHFLGGEITWECLPNGQYIFKMNHYWNCGGLSVNFSNKTISYLAGNITLKPDSNRWLLYNQGKLSHKGIDGCQLDCGTDIGAVEFYPYISNPVNLNGIPPSTGWTFSWYQCCRSPSAENLSAPASEGIYLRSIMYNYNNKSASNCYDSSPQFAELPVVAICDDMEFLYNPNGYDKDLDSLVFNWAKPWSAANTPVSYKSGYSYDSPMPDSSVHPSNIPASMETSTGTYSFKTNGTSNGTQYVKCIKIDSYREGIKVATVYRDVPIMPLDCPDLNSSVANNLPLVTVNGMPAKDYVDTVTAGETINLQIQSADYDVVYADPNDPTTAQLQKVALSPQGFMFSNDFTDSLFCPQGLSPCATLSPAPVVNAQNGKKELSGQGTVTTSFSWQTNCVHLGPDTGSITNFKLYNFLLKTYDNHCKTPGITYPTMKIVVARYLPIIQQNGNVLFTDPAQSYQWFYNGVPIPNSDSNAITITLQGDYSVEVVKYGCPSRRGKYKVLSLSLNESDWRSGFQIFPNPTEGIFYIHSRHPAGLEVNISDINGKLIYSKSFDEGFRSKKELNLTGQAKGVYFVKFQSKDFVDVRKIVLQ